MKTFLVDGEWNLRRNYKVRPDMFSHSGEHIGGVFGFIETLGIAINKILPDRVIVAWDGERSGLMRYNIYPLYKEGHKSWEPEYYIRTKEQLDAELRSKVSVSNQKLTAKNLLDGLFIRQAEVDEIEGDDLIAHYVNTKPEDEKIIIFSRDNDYYQLIDHDVFILNPNHKKDSNEPMYFTPDNFKKHFGFTLKNALMFKCINGDESDNITGIPGVGLQTILKYFPKFADEEYDAERLRDEASDIYLNKKKSQKMLTIGNIIGSKKILDINKQLMDLKNPMLNQQAKDEIEMIRHCVLAKEDGQVDRSIHDVMSEVVKDGYSKYMWNNDINHFFMPYNRIAAKEKEYTNKILHG